MSFGDFRSDAEEAMRIVVDLAALGPEDVARELPRLIERARLWRRQHTTSGGDQ